MKKIVSKLRKQGKNQSRSLEVVDKENVSVIGNTMDKAPADNNLEACELLLRVVIMFELANFCDLKSLQANHFEQSTVGSVNKPMDATKLLEIVARKTSNENYMSMSQQDAHEFLQYLLEVIEKGNVLFPNAEP